ncbi:hypothetical protein [Tautonia plasticadhaerens]|uniref:Uncharacterized protein n=1 Tax=Tautonia plasticadhaerens TaxID=2527974 RepID=A0A518HB39_9BACT|nr:hypothetical protein [Tautonia plasticadhaerens]QDV38078.1 hypothetical protein ElP_60260 [Tautonia plasticadhaerens]
MLIAPVDWSVVVLGAWNRAILTPSGISKRLFGLPAGTQLEVFVPLDVLAPFKVRHEDINVIAGSDRLIISPEYSTNAGIKKAMGIAKKALQSLPETPVTAAGINFRYKSEKPLEALAEAVGHEIDQAFSDLELLVLTRSVSRAVRWKKGEIRIVVSQEADQNYSILLNFHRESNETKDLIEWFSITTGTLSKQVDDILYKCLGIPDGSINNEDKKR